MNELQKARFKKLGMILLFFAFVVLSGYMLYDMFFRPISPDIEEEPSGTGDGTLGGIGEREPGTGLTEDDEDYIIIPVFDNPYHDEFIPVDSSMLIDIPVPTLLPEQSVQQETSSYYLIETVNTNITKSATLNEKSNALNFYDYDDQRFYKLDADGNKIALSDKQFYKVQDVTFSPVKDQAILEYPDGTTIMYDFDQEQQHTLPSSWTDFEFNNEGDKIAFRELNVQADYRWLSVANPDGTGKKLIQHLGENDTKIQINWSPNQQIVAQYPELENLSRSIVYFIGQNEENFKAIYVDGADVRLAWSPKGDSLLTSSYSPSSGFNPQLQIVSYDPSTNEATAKKTINLQTWADKCTYKDNATLICAVPTEMVSGAGMQPDVMKFTPDNLYEVDVKTGATRKILDNIQNYTMTNLSLGPDGNLYFIDQNSGTLNKVLLQ
jgi:hypothetical protein